ncbi:unnamed protein product [Timema podura]|uniref:DUF2428 domain-containing protein n=1 Tax=Timema podura TaxID=61482 RepID=A0ABN7NTH2_TIMPD|nr:unnamed protein product [Timema podura]
MFENKSSQEYFCTMMKQENKPNAKMMAFEKLIEEFKQCKIYFQKALQEEFKEDFKILRKLIELSQKLCTNEYRRYHSTEIVSDALKLCVDLFGILAYANLPLDALMVASTALCHVLLLALKPQRINKIFKSCFKLNAYRTFLCIRFTKYKCVKLVVQNVECFHLTLSHGILQLNSTSNVFEDPKNLKHNVSSLLCIIFNVLKQSCRKYSKYTLISFKTLVLWILKMIDYLGSGYCLTGKTVHDIFTIVNSNWESSINGVREQNTKILQLLFYISDEILQVDENGQYLVPFTASNILYIVMTEQPWRMKSKYFMLEILLPMYGVKKALEDFPLLTKGLVWSLSYSHLVSAGTLAYRACLKDIDENDWMLFFMPAIEVVVTTENNNDISVQEKNLFDYWILPTLKKFPSLLVKIIVYINKVSDFSKPSCSLLFCIISLVRLGRKKGIILSLWQPEMFLDTLFDLEYLTNIALQHSSEIIRSQCFSMICSTSKTSATPTTTEFLMISLFLIENVNTDNAAFRQSIFNSFVLFLLRIRESCYKEIKKRKYTVLNTIKMEETNQPVSLNGHECSNLLYKSLVNNCIFTDTQMDSESAFTKSVYFLEWLYYFITLNLEPGSNYQRKILSLQLCESVLMYLGSVGEHNQKTSMFNQKKLSPTESFAVMKCIIECGKWHFTSEESRKMLLVCVEDSTDDIRETAARILIHFFYFRENVNEVKKLLRKALYLCKSSKFYTAESGALLIKIINAWIYRMQKNNANKKVEIRELISYIYLNSEIGIQLDIYENNPLSNEQKGHFEIEEFSKISSSDEDYSDNPTPNQFNNIVLDAQKKLLIGLKINPDTFQDDLYEQSSLFPWNINKSELHYDNCIPISEQNNTKSRKKRRTINETIKMVYKTSDETMKISLKSRPRTFEGLVVEDIKELEKISGSQIPDRMKSFEGLCVVNPKDGLVGPNIMKAVISSPEYKTNKPSTSANVCGKKFVKTQKISQSTLAYQTIHKHFASIKFGTLASQTDINENGRKMSFITQPQKCAEYLETLPPLHFQTHGSDNTIYSSSKSPNDVSDSGRPCTLSGLLLCCAEWQAQLLQQDLWQAASSGAPLHGLLTALSLVAAHPTGAEISILNAAEVESLVCLMESVVAHLLSVLASKANNITNFAPSFAEMAEAIDSTFCDILSRDEEEVMDITPAHQLVINCIWFNLKACCNLSSELASIESTTSDIAERCGLLIVRVLKQCRHKGVIESAGMSLSNLVKMMTSNKCMHACHDLPERILTGFLDLLQEGSSAASVTRKCAGLAILVHKIVASDKHKNRPLLHLCVSRLLKIATDPVRLYSSDTSDLPSTQALHFLCMLVQDSALCQYVAAYMSDITQLCFKKLSSNIWTVRNAALQLFGALVPKLVGEKKNNDENMIGGNTVTVEEFFYHYPTLVELLLSKLQSVSTSTDLLQHSALVPMLYLLSKLSVGVQAFFNQECCENVRKLRKCFMTLTSSKIIAVRKLSAKAYVNFTPFSNISANMENILDDMNNLDKKFDYIRCINTRTHESYGYPPRLVLDFDDTIYTVPENELHGVLTILLYQQERLENESVEMSNLTSHLSERLIGKISEMRFFSFLQIDAITYYNRALVNELYLKVCSHIEAPVYDAAIEVLSLHEILQNKYETSKLKLGCVTIPCVGLSVWAKTFVEILLYNCSQHQLEEALIAIFKMSRKVPNYTEAALEATKYRLKKETHIVFADVKTRLLCAFITTIVRSTYISHQIIFHILDTMLFLLKEGNLIYETIAIHDDFQFIIKAFQEKSLNKVFKTNSYISLPVMCGLVAIHIQHSYNASSTEEKITLFLKVVQVLSESCNPQSRHEDFRLGASVSLQLLALTLKVIIAYRSFLVSNKCLDVIGRKIVDSTLTLLQDESTCVRNEAAKFVAIYDSYSNISTTEHRMLSSSNCIKMVLKVDFLLTLLSRQVALFFLWESLSCLKDLENIRTRFIGVQHMEDITNPFDHGVRNIYAEETKVIDLFAQSLLTFVHSSNNSELIELKKLASVRAESYDADIEYVLQLLKKEFDQDDCTHISSSMLTTLSVVSKKLKYQLLLMFRLKVCSSDQMVTLCKKIGFENL